MVNSFFCKRMNYWLFMDCHRPSAFAMTKGQVLVNSFIFLWMNKEVVVYGLLRFARNDEKRVVIARVALQLVAISVWQPLHTTQACHCESQHLHIVIAIIKPSLRGLEKPVAISVWDTINHSWNSFSFWFFILTFYGLWIASSPCSSQWRRGVGE